MFGHPYLYENELKFADGKTDYPSMMAVPKNESPAPQYHNIQSSASDGSTANEDNSNINVKSANHPKMTNPFDHMDIGHVRTLQTDEWLNIFNLLNKLIPHLT